jgi:hypothetical protein
MAGFEMFDRELKLATRDLEPAQINRALALFAKESLSDVIRSGAASPNYETFVNGRPGAAEESVQAPGPIVYLFSNWSVVVKTAIEELQKRVPRKSGRYASSFVATYRGAEVTDYSSLPPDAEVVIFNYQPYTRKMETGANRTGGRHFDLARAAVNRRFGGAFNTQVAYINVAPGVAPGAPYILRAGQGRRKDRQAGKPITYPALVITAD